MTDWSDVRRDPDGDWETKTGRCPHPVMPVNGQGSYAEWGRAAEFCRAVADEVRAEAEAEEAARETELKLKVARICSEAHLMHNPAEAIIRTVREHDA